MATTHRPTLDRAISDLLATARELRSDAHNQVRRTFARRKRPAEPATPPTIDVAAVRAAARDRRAAREGTDDARAYAAVYPVPAAAHGATDADERAVYGSVYPGRV
ncbi:hypothetical protein V5H98_15030 [Georgenia sp. M64]|uniref:hypothetical protein n=1 Tax=Georgenia sp. M64 TaxID=3120520 RepID=UPI0030DFBDCD